MNAQDTGRLAYRLPEDPPDERELVLRPRPFWSSEAEQYTYEAAVEKNPRRPGEGPMAYAERIAAVVAGVYRSVGQSMPRARMSQREWQGKQYEVKAGGRVLKWEEPL
jgi:hypothetical protein